MPIQITQNTSKAQLGNIRVSGNYLNDGGCTLNVARTPAPIGTFSVTDNRFGPGYTFRVWPEFVTTPAGVR